MVVGFVGVDLIVGFVVVDSCGLRKFTYSSKTGSLQLCLVQLGFGRGAEGVACLR